MNVPTRLCLVPQCPNPVRYRGRCATHARERERQTHPNKSIYNSKRWKVLRRRVLFEEPLCRRCGRLTTDVDHITPIERGGPPFERANCQGLCATCHGQKTRSEQTAA